MIKLFFILILLGSCSTPMTKDCPMRKKGLACHQKVVKNVLNKSLSKEKALKEFKNCCDKLKYKNSCKEVENYN